MYTTIVYNCINMFTHIKYKCIQLYNIVKIGIQLYTITWGSGLGWALGHNFIPHCRCHARDLPRRDALRVPTQRMLPSVHLRGGSQLDRRLLRARRPTDPNQIHQQSLSLERLTPTRSPTFWSGGNNLASSTSHDADGTWLPPRAGAHDYKLAHCHATRKGALELSNTYNM